MKWCGTCQQNLDESEFNKNKCKKDGLNTLCRTCSAKRSKVYYQENKQHHKATTSQNRKVYRKKISTYLNAIKACGCCLCPEKTFCCLEFHHLDPSKKEYDIGRLAWDGSAEKLKAELAKCCVICSNCHRKLHAGMVDVEGKLNAIVI